MALINNQSILPFTKEYVPSVAKIHLNALPDDFLPSLGQDFLKTFYNSITKKDDIIGFVFISNNQVAGFIVGVTNMTGFFVKTIKNNFLSFCYVLTKQIILKPSIIKQVIETLFFPNKETGPKAELVVIAVHRDFHGQSIGKKLVKNLEIGLNKSGVQKYKVSVTKKNINANKFYENLGFIHYDIYELYGKKFNLLYKNID